MHLKKSRFFTALLIFCAIFMGQTACKTAEGCQLEEKYQAQTDRHGNLSKKKGKSNLFSKKQRKKMSSNK